MSNYMNFVNKLNENYLKIDTKILNPKVRNPNKSRKNLPKTIYDKIAAKNSKNNNLEFNSKSKNNDNNHPRGVTLNKDLDSSINNRRMTRRKINNFQIKKVNIYLSKTKKKIVILKKQNNSHHLNIEHENIITKNEKKSEIIHIIESKFSLNSDNDLLCESHAIKEENKWTNKKFDTYSQDSEELHHKKELSFGHQIKENDLSETLKKSKENDEIMCDCYENS